MKNNHDMTNDLFDIDFVTVLTKTASNVSGIIPNLRISFHIYTPRISDVKLAQISFNFRNMQEKTLSGVMVMYITVSRKITLQ